jgi:PIN domain nuclease of toxin-antitoxin system
MTDAYVSDTHPLIFHAQGGKLLGPRARRVFAEAEHERTIVYVPAIVLWEFSLLVRVGKVRIAQTSVERFSEDLFSNPAYQPLPATVEHVAFADSHRPNEDPFDALICAAACALGLPLITRDSRITAAPWVKTLW